MFNSCIDIYSIYFICYKHWLNQSLDFNTITCFIVGIVARKYPTLDLFYCLLIILLKERWNSSYHIVKKSSTTPNITLYIIVLLPEYQLWSSVMRWRLDNVVKAGIFFLNVFCLNDWYEIYKLNVTYCSFTFK